MMIKEALDKLNDSVHPVARLMHKGDGFKMLLIVFKKGMIMSDHKTELDAKLFVMRGSILFRLPDSTHELNENDNFDIPAGVIHSLTANEDSICILSQCK